MSKKFVVALWGMLCLSVASFAQVNVTGTTECFTEETGKWETTPDEPTFLYEKGDVNHSGKVDVTDVAVVVGGILGNANPNYDATLADVDDDGIVDTDDVVALVDKCLGKEEEPIVVEEFDIVNPVAKDYMKNSYSTFTTSSYLDNSSFKTLRASAFKNYRCDQPNTKTITFATDSPTARVIMATDKKYKNVVLNKEVTVVNGVGSYMLRNFVPGRAYYYKVVNGENVLTSGALKATGQLRMIHINDSWNIRDIGGWTGWEGNKVRYEEIYRGGSLGGICNGTTDVISQESGEELKRIGLKAHLDLRSMYEDVSKVDWKGTTPGAFSLGYSPIPDADFLLMVCSWALNNPTKNSSVIGGLAYVIKSVLDGKPVYFHCRTGADRTGTVGFLIEGLLGMYPYTAGNNAAEMAMEYELTGLSMDEDGTIAYNNGTMTTPTYSNRQASSAKAYGFFNTLLNSSTDIPSTYSMQDRCYYYVNRYFKDNTVSTAGKVYINKSDLDRFINYMLGITDREGNVIDGKTKYVGPTWANDDTENSLQHVIDTALENEFNH